MLFALIWAWIFNQILIAGSLIRYDGLQSLGSQVVSFMTRINPYLWWGIAIILTLIVLSLARAWFKSSIAAGKRVMVSVGEVQKLSQSMSPQGVEVLLWVWDKEIGPVTVGDLLLAREQIRSGRARKIAAAKAQYQALSDAVTNGQPVQQALAERVQAEPTFNVAAATAATQNEQVVV